MGKSFKHALFDTVFKFLEFLNVRNSKKNSGSQFHHKGSFLAALRYFCWGAPWMQMGAAGPWHSVAVNRRKRMQEQKPPTRTG